MQARVQVFLLPGEARVAELIHLVEVSLAGICAITASCTPGTWRLARTGPEPYRIPGKRYGFLPVAQVKMFLRALSVAVRVPGRESACEHGHIADSGGTARSIQRCLRS
jgi:hypothetical protein